MGESGNFQGIELVMEKLKVNPRKIASNPFFYSTLSLGILVMFQHFVSYTTELIHLRSFMSRDLNTNKLKYILMP